MSSRSARIHPVVNDIYVADDDPDRVTKIHSFGLHAFRVPVGNSWYTLRYYRVYLDRSGELQIDAWDGGTYPASWYETDWSVFGWSQKKRPHLHLVK